MWKSLNNTQNTVTLVSQVKMKIKMKVLALKRSIVLRKLSQQVKWKDRAELIAHRIAYCRFICDPFQRLPAGKELDLERGSDFPPESVNQ